MSNKNLVMLAGAAIVLAGAAYFMNSGRKSSAPGLMGKPVLSEFDIATVASIEIGDKVKLVAADDGWKIESLRGYPADKAKIVENMLKLKELKVGQVARGRAIAQPVEVSLKDASGNAVASLTLGEKHVKQSSGESMYGGYPDGRYVKCGDATVLVTDTLDAFDGDPKRWCDTHIVDTPYVSFTGIADPALSEDELGFATGKVCKVTVKGDTNRVATVGATVKGGSDRYLKLDGDNWIYTVASYTADSVVKAAEEAEKKAAEEKEKAEAKPEEAKPAEAKPADEPKPAEAKPAEESKPAEAKPAVESKPVEAKPAAESKPAESK